MGNSTYTQYYASLDRGGIARLARQSGISRQQLHNFYKGKSLPSIPTMSKIEQATGGTVAFESWKPGEAEEEIDSLL